MKRENEHDLALSSRARESPSQIRDRRGVRDGGSVDRQVRWGTWHIREPCAPPSWRTSTCAKSSPFSVFRLQKTNKRGTVGSPLFADAEVGRAVFHRPKACVHCGRVGQLHGIVSRGLVFVFWMLSSGERSTRPLVVVMTAVCSFSSMPSTFAQKKRGREGWPTHTMSGY
jgi:hypothetical protein